LSGKKLRKFTLRGITTMQVMLFTCMFKK
jgi:hypothetical protein